MTSRPYVCDSTCETRILKNTENCCVDFLLAYPVSCIPLHNTADKRVDFWKQVKMITGCYLPQVNVGLKTMCEDISTNAFQQIPVTFGRMTYRNVYCYLCNHPETSNKTMTPVQHLFLKDLHLWDITLHGNQFIDAKYFVHADRLFQYAMKMNFYVHFRPDTVFSERCSLFGTLGIPNIVKCNATGRWKAPMTDLLWACEHIHQDRMPEVLFISIKTMKLGQYKNEFCLACNPGWFEEFIEECNVTGYLKTLNSDDEFLCKNSALERQYWPFRNEYCDKCNPQFHYSQVGDPLFRLPGNPDYYDNDPDEDYNMDFSLDTNDVENVQETDCSHKVSCRIDTDAVGLEEDDNNEFSFRQLFALSEYEQNDGILTQKGIDEQCINSDITQTLLNVSLFYFFTY